jgi:lipoprotein signal peptidase
MMFTAFSSSSDAGRTFQATFVGVLGGGMGNVLDDVSRAVVAFTAVMMNTLMNKQQRTTTSPPLLNIS